MRHQRAGRKLGRTTEHRIATLRTLSTSLFRHERIKTTLAKAKDLRPFAEKLITKAKKGDLHSRRIVAQDIHDAEVLQKLFESVGPRFADRPGGYLRITKLGWRRGDSAEMAVIEMVDGAVVASEPSDKKAKAAPAEETKAEAAEETTEEEAVEASAEEATEEEAVEAAAEETSEEASEEPAEESGEETAEEGDKE